METIWRRRRMHSLQLDCCCADSETFAATSWCNADRTDAFQRKDTRRLSPRLLRPISRVRSFLQPVVAVPRWSLLWTEEAQVSWYRHPRPVNSEEQSGYDLKSILYISESETVTNSLSWSETVKTSLPLIMNDSDQNEPLYTLPYMSFPIVCSCLLKVQRPRRVSCYQRLGGWSTTQNCELVVIVVFSSWFRCFWLISHMYRYAGAVGDMLLNQWTTCVPMCSLVPAFIIYALSALAILCPAISVK